MRNPRALFYLGLALAVVGLVLLVFGVMQAPLRQGSQMSIQEKTPIFFGVLGLAGGLILALMKWFDLRELTKLLNNVDVLARWQIGPGDLAAFHRADVARAALYPTLRNYLRLPGSVPATGLSIALTQDAMLVGDTMHGIGTGNVSTVGMPCEVEIIEGAPAMLEITMGKTAFEDPTSNRLFSPALKRPFWVMRLPVPAEARAAAEAACAGIDAAIWKVNRDWARLTYADHFAIADRGAAGRGTVPHAALGVGTAVPALAAVLGTPPPAGLTSEPPRYRAAQVRFFSGVAGLTLAFGINMKLRFDTDFGIVMAILWVFLFFVSLGLTLHGGYYYLLRRER
jgi:hypothetical protein